MMSAVIRPNFGSGRVRASRVVYVCDVASASSAVIPLGVMADISYGEWLGLALVARIELSEEEAGMVGGFLRSKVRRPFEGLEAEFLRVWESVDTAAAFESLSACHMGALRFEIPTLENVAVPPQVARGSENVVEQWINNILDAKSTNEYWSMIYEQAPGEDIPVLSGTNKKDRRLAA